MPQPNRFGIIGQVTPYLHQSVTVENVLFTGPIELYADFWQELAATSGVDKQENHDVYGISKGRDAIYFMFSNGRVYIGTDIKRQNVID